MDKIQVLNEAKQLIMSADQIVIDLTANLELNKVYVREHYRFSKDEHKSSIG